MIVQLLDHNLGILRVASSRFPLANDRHGPIVHIVVYGVPTNCYKGILTNCVSSHMIWDWGWMWYAAWNSTSEIWATWPSQTSGYFVDARVLWYFCYFPCVKYIKRAFPEGFSVNYVLLWIKVVPTMWYVFFKKAYHIVKMHTTWSCKVVMWPCSVYVHAMLHM